MTRTGTAGICFVAVAAVGVVAAVPVESAGRESAASTLTATTPINVRLAATRSVLAAARSVTDAASCEDIVTSCAILKGTFGTSGKFR
jgi:hypothetical protein